jgi:hypothetical protein
MTTKQLIQQTGIKSKQILTSAKKRVLSKTPKKYVKWRNVALIIAGIGGAILAAPAAPAWLAVLAPWLVWGGNTAAGIVHVLE